MATEWGRRGFTLLEIMVAASIVLLVGAFGLRSLSGGQSRVQSKGLAEELAEELRATRALAVARQAPIAIVFPSNGGTTGISRSFYQLEGPSEPLATREIDYSSSYPQACIFVGIWGSGSTTEPNTGTNSSDFDLDQDWTLQQPADYHLIFTPSGSVITNGLANFGDGYFDILVANGVSETGGTAWKTPTLYTPTAANDPYTVRVSPTGAVGVGKGSWGGPLAQGATFDGSVAKTTPDTAGTNTRPTIDAVLSEPQTNQNTDHGALAVCGEERYINIVVEASDVEGDQLYMSCEAFNNNNAAGVGSFSSSYPTAMTYDHGKNRWVGFWAWSPPLNAGEGTTFRIEAKVTDGSLQSLPAELHARIQGVEFELVNKLACVNEQGSAGTETHEVVWLNSEGTNVFSLTLARENLKRSTPAWAPNGHKLCFYAMKNLVPGKVEARLVTVNEDGADMRRLLTVIGRFRELALGPSFSPTSDHVTCTAFEDETTNTSSVYVARTYEDVTAERKTFPSPPISHRQARWHPEADWILFAEHDSSSLNRKLRYINPWDTSEVYDAVTAVVDTLGDASWSAQGDAICYVKGTQVYIRNVNVNTHVNGPETALTPPNTYEPEIPRFSPDKKWLAFVNRLDEDLYVVKLDASGNPDGAASPLTNGADVEFFCWNSKSNEIVYNTGGLELYIVKVPKPAPPVLPKNITPKNFQASTTPAWWAP